MSSLSLYCSDSPCSFCLTQHLSQKSFPENCCEKLYFIATVVLCTWNFIYFSSFVLALSKFDCLNISKQIQWVTTIIKQITVSEERQKLNGSCNVTRAKQPLEKKDVNGRLGVDSSDYQSKKNFQKTHSHSSLRAGETSVHVKLSILHFFWFFGWLKRKQLAKFWVEISKKNKNLTVLLREDFGCFLANDSTCFNWDAWTAITTK